MQPKVYLQPKELQVLSAHSAFSTQEGSILRSGKNRKTQKQSPRQTLDLQVGACSTYSAFSQPSRIPQFPLCNFVDLMTEKIPDDRSDQETLSHNDV